MNISFENMLTSRLDKYVSQLGAIENYVLEKDAVINGQPGIDLVTTNYPNIILIFAGKSFLLNGSWPPVGIQDARGYADPDGRR